MQLKADILYNSIYVMTKYLYKACFTDFIRCQWESIFCSAGVAAILRECIFFAGIPSRPALKIFNPTPSRSRGSHGTPAMRDSLLGL